MLGKPYTVLIYVISGLIIALWPIAVPWALQSDSRLFRPFRTWAEHGKGALKRSIPFTWPLGIGVGLLIGSTLIWWRQPFAGSSMLELFIYSLIVIALSAFLAQNIRSSEKTYRATLIWSFGIIAIIAFIILSYSTGIFELQSVSKLTWHHWGAFIGPSELMIGGARILHDVPAQYGLGPTSLIAAACGSNCWLGMHYVVAAATLAFSLTIMTIAMSMTFRSLKIYLTSLLIVAAVCFFWNAYPPQVTSPRMAPSVSGIRFLPATLLVTAIILSNDNKSAAHWKIIGFFFYTIGAFWSPESLFLVTYVWWPYYLWRASAEYKSSPFFTIALAALELLITSFTILGGLLIAYRLHYGVLPELDLYLAYILYPPGELPIDPAGPVWFSVAALLLGLLTLSHLLIERRNNQDTHRAILIILLSFATISYCMGRGHSNNFLNILPFTAMILIMVLTLDHRLTCRAIAAGMLISLLAWLSIFGWDSWAAAIKAERFFKFAPNQILASFSYENDRSGTDDFSEIRRTLATIREKSSDPIEIIDENYLPLVSSPKGAWNAFHGPANVFFLPREKRLKILKNIEKRLKKSGWVVIRRDFLAEWIDDYRSVYNVSDEFDVGNYRVFHFTPRD